MPQVQNCVFVVVPTDLGLTFVCSEQAHMCFEIPRSSLAAPISLVLRKFLLSFFLNFSLFLLLRLLFFFKRVSLSVCVCHTFRHKSNFYYALYGQMWQLATWSTYSNPLLLVSMFHVNERKREECVLKRTCEKETKMEQNEWDEMRFKKKKIISSLSAIWFRW